MTLRNATVMAICVAALGGIAAQSSAHAQASPFTIRKPLDGAHVREKVRIEIPRASIGKGGFVAFYLDPSGPEGGAFMLGMAPAESDEDNGQPFTYIWDTKEAKVSDGEHSIKAILYEPAGGTGNIAMSEKATTEVHVTVENKIHSGPDVPTSFLLRYKYIEGEQLTYNRVGKSVIVGHDSAMGGVRSDVEMMSAKSKLLFSVEDVRFDHDAQANLALVRNKLTELSILNGGQEYSLQPTALSNSMYQELLPEGRVHYETGATSGLAEFMAQGLPVNNTLELPLMPTLRVSVGDTWTTPGQRLDIPGLPPVLQPVVTLNNKLVDLEYEGGYPCVKIHQSFSGTLSNVLSQVTHEKFKALPFGGMLITSPSLTYDRDIFLSYNSGTLIRTARTLVIKGRTTSNMGDVPPAAGGGGSFNPGGMGGPNTGGKMGMGKMGGGVMSGGPNTGGFPGGGFPGSGGPGRGAPGSGGIPGRGAGGKGGGLMGGPGSGGRGPNSGGGIRGAGGGNPFGGGGGYNGGAEEVDHPITIRSTTDTDILTQTGVTKSHPAVHPASLTKMGRAKKGK